MGEKERINDRKWITVKGSEWQCWNMWERLRMASVWKRKRERERVSLRRWINTVQPTSSFFALGSVSFLPKISNTFTYLVDSKQLKLDVNCTLILSLLKYVVFSGVVTEIVSLRWGWALIERSCATKTAGTSVTWHVPERERERER